VRCATREEVGKRCVVTRARRLAPYLFVPLMLHFHAPTVPTPPSPSLPPPAQSQPSAPSTTLPAPAPTNGWTPNDGTGVTWAQYVAWSRVATCEEGGWIGWSGPTYPDSLGVNAVNWWAAGGTTTVSPDAQIVVAEHYAGSWVPDQGYCASW